MNAFEEMLAQFKNHLGTWPLPPPLPEKEAGFVLLACPWLCTSVPFYSMEIACGLRHHGVQSTLLWDATRPELMPVLEGELEGLETAVKSLPPWLEKIYAAENEFVSLPDDLREVLKKTFWNHAIWVAKGEAEATDLLEKNPHARKNYLSHAEKVYSLILKLGSRNYVLPGGMFGLGGMYHSIIRHLGYQVSIYDLGWDSVMIAHGGCAAHFADFPTAFHRISKVLGKKPWAKIYIRDEVEKMMAQRKSGRDSVQSQKRALNPDLRHGCDILLCLNNRSDTAALGRERLFASVRDWIEALNEWSLQHPKFRIFIRQHPHERHPWLQHTDNYGSLVRRWDPTGERLVFVPADSDINTYELLLECKVVLPYTSTVGIEAALAGKTVVIGTKCYYGELDFVQYPLSREDYFRCIEAGLEQAVPLSPEKCTQASLAFYILLNFAFLKTDFVPSDCRPWAKRNATGLWRESSQKIITQCLLEKDPVLYLQFLSFFKSPLKLRFVWPFLKQKLAA